MVRLRLPTQGEQAPLHLLLDGLPFANMLKRFSGTPAPPTWVGKSHCDSRARSLLQALYGPSGEGGDYSRRRGGGGGELSASTECATRSRMDDSRPDMSTHTPLLPVGVTLLNQSLANTDIPVQTLYQVCNLACPTYTLMICGFAYAPEWPGCAALAPRK